MEHVAGKDVALLRDDRFAGAACARDEAVDEPSRETSPEYTGDSSDTLTLYLREVWRNESLLDHWIDALSHREREVLEGRFGLHDREPKTLEELSHWLGITRERVRQIQIDALLKLKRQMFRDGFSGQAAF